MPFWRFPAQPSQQDKSTADFVNTPIPVSVSRICTEQALPGLGTSHIRQRMVTELCSDVAALMPADCATMLWWAPSTPWAAGGPQPESYCTLLQVTRMASTMETTTWEAATATAMATRTRASLLLRVTCVVPAVLARPAAILPWRAHLQIDGALLHIQMHAAEMQKQRLCAAVPQTCCPCHVRRQSSGHAQASSQPFWRL